MAERAHGLREQPAELLDRLRLAVVLGEVDVDELAQPGRHECGASPEPAPYGNARSARVERTARRPRPCGWARFPGRCAWCRTSTRPSSGPRERGRRTAARARGSLSTGPLIIHDIYRSAGDSVGMHYCGILLLGIFLVLILMLVVLA